MGLFSKHKDVAENKQTQEIKQAAISDTQTNNITQNPTEQEQSQTLPSTSQPSSFVNPFSNQNTTPQTQTTPMAQQQPVQTATPNSQQQVQNATPAAQQPVQTAENANPFGLSGDDKNNFLEQEKQTAAAEQQPAQQAATQEPILTENTAQQQLSKDEITEMIDETVEKLIEEKWDTLVDNVNKILKWKETTESQIHMLKDDILNISEGFSKLENKLISKISNYDKDILDVNSEIKALEKVFQKITPTLINNVNELAKIADDFKGTKSKAKKVEEDKEETPKQEK